MMVRGLLHPFRVMAVTGSRGLWTRSLAVLVLKQFDPLHWLLADLEQIRPVDRADLKFSAVDSMVLRAVYWYGVQGYEGVLSRIWPLLCERSTSILEVGGNVGLYAVLGGAHCKAAYRVLEPLPEVAEQIRRNLRLNGIAHVEVVQAAAIPMPTAQTVAMNIPVEDAAVPVGAHLLQGTEVSGRSSGQIIEVPGVPFIELVRDAQLVKIDAEGIEATLLESAYDRIVTHRPTIVIEVLPESVHLGELICRLARDADYRLFVIPAYGSDRPVLVEPGKFDSTVPARHRSKDVILTRLDLMALL